jgi:multidrug efflux pump subunit AcrA (membrane-fusion protein)
MEEVGGCDETFYSMYFFIPCSDLLPGCKAETPKKEMIRPVRAIQISDPAEFTKRWFPGQAKATQEVDLSFRVAGPLVTLPVNVGDTVRKGQELAKIDPRDYKVNLRNTQGQLERAKATLKGHLNWRCCNIKRYLSITLPC